MSELAIPGSSSPTPYLATFVAAYTSITPPFRYFIIKSYIQQEVQVPHISFAEGIIRGTTKAGPIIGLQACVAKAVKQKFASDSGEPASLATTIGSATTVAALSVVPLQIFSGFAMEWSVRQSLQALTPRLAGAMFGREVSFLVPLALNNTISEKAVEIFGDNKPAEYGSVVITSTICSLFGQPFDTATVRWPNNLKINSIRDAMLGWKPRAFGIASFSVLNKFALDTLH